MISDLAHKQNQARRKELEALGYKFSVGHDGWTLFLKGEEIDAGRIYHTTGEQLHRACLDAAVHRAQRHRTANEVPEVAPAAPAAPPKKESPMAKEVKKVIQAIVQPPVDEGTQKLQRQAVQKAVAFLKMAGAEYSIAWAGETFTNIAPKKMQTTEFKDHYLPLLAPFQDLDSFTTTIAIPESLDLERYVTAIRNYLQGKLGKGNYLTQSDRKARTIQIMAARVGD